MEQDKSFILQGSCASQEIIQENTLLERVLHGLKFNVKPNLDSFRSLERGSKPKITS